MPDIFLIISLWVLVPSNGYMVGRIYRAGIDDRKRDTLFYTALFGSIGQVCFSLGLFYGSLMSAILSALIIPFVTMIVLKSWGHWIFRALRATRITHNNNLGTVWEALTNDTRCKIYGVIVYLKDGTCLTTWLGDLPGNYSRDHFGTIRYDKQGNIAIHAHKVTWPDGRVTEYDDEHEADSGALMFIKSSEIQRVKFCYN